MAFLSKDTLIQAYKVLSTNTENPSSQGATQLISAVRYLFALDQFFESAKKDCDTKVDADKNSFVSNVGQVVSLSDGTYTSNFYNAIKNDSDYKVGSNFFSVNAVNNSLVNPTLIVEFPKRTPKIMTIQNGVLKRDTSLFRNIGSYLRSNYARIAFALWLVRNENIKLLTDVLTWTDVRTNLLDKYSSDLVDELVPPGSTSFNDYCTRYGQPATDSIPAIINKEDIVSLFSTTEEDTEMSQYNLPLQTIFYGAPGTGKSYKVNELTKGDDTVIRTTFHPDSDYASFVGCYKPVTKEDKPLMQVVADFATRQAISIPVLDSAGNTVYDTSITYQFTQQAFLKAYIQAWKKLCKNNHSAAASSITTVVPPVGSVSLSFPVKNITYTIIEVTKNSIRVKREFDLIKNSVKNVWESLWTSGDFIIPRGSQSGRSVQIAVCRWIYENLDDSTKDSFDDGWTLLIDTLNSGEVYVSVADSKSSQVYTVTKIEDNDASVHISNVASSKRARLKKCFEGTKPYGVEIGLIDVLKRIDPESFDGAWETLTGKITKGENEYSDIQDDELLENKEEDGLMTDPQYLVIEEINRGNCAQIFGDIFQLLDRNDAGFSTYPIVPDADITRELKKVFASLDLSSVENYINGIFSENYPSGIVDKIKSGELLVLPCNLNLLATMNTSDQSLFPMDSAFKRRWDWEYVSIRYEKTKEEEEKEKNDPKDNFDTFTITIGDKGNVSTYLWTDFLQKVNAKILFVTDSEDKQMGEYFIKKSVDQKTFINKVMYYLWSEVGKDNFNSTNNALFVLPDGLIKETKDGIEEDKKEFSFNELFKDNATKLLQGFMKKLEVKSEEEKAATPTPAIPAEV